MPRYYFHTEDGELVLDEAGCELEGADAARIQAAALLGRLLLDAPERVLRAAATRVSCVDETGLVLVRLEASASTAASPTLMRPQAGAPAQLLDA